MNLDLSSFSHEIASIIIGALVSWIGNKARRVAKDINCVWPRLRQLEMDVADLKKAQTIKGAS